MISLRADKWSTFAAVARLPYQERTDPLNRPIFHPLELPLWYMCNYLLHQRVTLSGWCGNVTIPDLCLIAG